MSTVRHAAAGERHATIHAIREPMDGAAEPKPPAEVHVARPGSARRATEWLKAARRERRRDMLGWVGDIEQATLENGTFRTVLFTGEHTQLTVMSLGPGEDIGHEAHPDADQFLRIEQGLARVEFGSTADRIEETHDVRGDWAIVIPAGVWHNVVNTGVGDLKLYSLYSPAQHPVGTVHRTKAEAVASEHGLDA
jgi:mannose-6-phosphate isomerase-like protein (cupin superfamily)